MSKLIKAYEKLKEIYDPIDAEFIYYALQHDHYADTVSGWILDGTISSITLDKGIALVRAFGTDEKSLLCSCDLSGSKQWELTVRSVEKCNKDPVKLVKWGLTTNKDTDKELHLLLLEGYAIGDMEIDFSDNEPKFQITEQGKRKITREK